MRFHGPQRLGHLIEAGWYLRVDCRRCGHWSLARPLDLTKKHGPSMPWRWLRFCCACGARKTIVNVGPADHLRQLDIPPPVHRRPDLIGLVAAGITTKIPGITPHEAGAAAEAALWRMIDAGFEITEETHHSDGPPAA